MPLRRVAWRDVVPEAGGREAVPGLRRPRPLQGDEGAADKGVFKVPSLRNVEKTGPYYHDGKVASLEQAIRDMAEYQLAKKLSDEQVEQIVVFLKVLTGKIDRNTSRRRCCRRAPRERPSPTSARPYPGAGAWTRTSTRLPRPDRVDRHAAADGRHALLDDLRAKPSRIEVRLRHPS